MGAVQMRHYDCPVCGTFQRAYHVPTHRHFNQARGEWYSVAVTELTLDQFTKRKEATSASQPIPTPEPFEKGKWIRWDSAGSTGVGIITGVNLPSKGWLRVVVVQSGHSFSKPGDTRYIREGRAVVIHGFIRIKGAYLDQDI